MEFESLFMQNEHREDDILCNKIILVPKMAVKRICYSVIHSYGLWRVKNKMFHSFFFFFFFLIIRTWHLTKKKRSTVPTLHYMYCTVHTRNPIKNIKPLLQALQIKFIVHSTCVFEINTNPDYTDGNGACGEWWRWWY